MRFKVPLLLAVLAAILSAQQISVGMASAAVGQTAHLSATLTTGSAQISSLQFDLTYDTAALTVTAVAGNAALVAGKSVATNPLATGLRVLVVGLNQKAFANGSVADLTIQVAANAANGTYPLALSNLSASDNTGSTTNLGSSSGSLTVTGAASNLPVITGVSNSPGGQPAIAANTWVSIYGSNFAAAGSIDDWSKFISNGNLPASLDGVSVTVGGTPAYVSYLSSTQINILTPNIGLGSLSVAVKTAAGTSAPAASTAQQVSPAFFPWPGGQPVATHADFSYAVKNGTFVGVINVPAQPGEPIILWGTGFGPTTPTAPTGVEIPGTQVYYTANPVSVTIGGAPASVYACALASNFAGLYQLVVTVPASMANGDYPLIATVSGVSTPTTTLTVHN